MYYPHRFKRMYQRFLGPLARSITLEVWNGTDHDAHTLKAHVSGYQESDLVPDGPVRLGDLRVIVLADDVPAGLTDPGERDRFQIDGRPYGIIMWDAHSRAVGDTRVAIEVAVRGG